MTIRDTLRAFLMRSPAGAEWVACRALRRDSHLRHAGWFRSVYKSASVDAADEPLPWYTYAAIHFVAGRVQPEMSVFEYGSGNSTLWWSRRVAHVSSSEHDRQWYTAMKDQFPANVNCQFVELDEQDSYPLSIRKTSQRFDVIVIDGRQRNRCAQAALDALTDRGVIIWDNTDREEYRPGVEGLLQANFRRLDFHGMAPINTLASCTSVFYRPGNVFGI